MTMIINLADMNIKNNYHNMLLQFKNRTCEYDWELDNTKKNQIKLLEMRLQYLKWSIYQVGLIVDVFHNRLDHTKENTDKPEDTAIEIVQNGALRGKKKY